ncbi:dihydrodipicolinate synthase family protein [Nonomuraea sp. B12E4]|uniref:dihydrodipicolinate synthase family protein n=1 Tax=Nonomuraea sp. B12E4 TaxID=3153564 RepID=UPI00325DFA6B
MRPGGARELFRAVNRTVDGLFIGGTTGEFPALVVGDCFARIRDAAGTAGLYAYLYPDRTNTDVSPEQLAALPGLAGVKLSGAASGDVASHVALATAPFEVYSGNDVRLAAVAEQGGTGVVSGLSVAFPEVFGGLARTVADGGTAARALLQKVADEAGAAPSGAGPRRDGRVRSLARAARLLSRKIKAENADLPYRLTVTATSITSQAGEGGGPPSRACAQERPCPRCSPGWGLPARRCAWWPGCSSPGCPARRPPRRPRR